jgi:hypothetical protein
VQYGQNLIKEATLETLEAGSKIYFRNTCTYDKQRSSFG